MIFGKFADVLLIFEEIGSYEVWGKQEIIPAHFSGKYLTFPNFIFLAVGS